MMMITSRHHRDGCLQAPPVLRGNSEDRRTSLHLTHCMVMMIMYDVDDLVCLVSCGGGNERKMTRCLVVLPRLPSPLPSSHLFSFLLFFLFLINKYLHTY